MASENDLFEEKSKNKGKKTCKTGALGENHTVVTLVVGKMTEWDTPN